MRTPVELVKAALAWLAGLRIQTRARRDWENELLDIAFRGQAKALEDAERAHAEKRGAQRILAILSEPLKDWDLADFPRTGPEATRHLNAIVQAYGIVRADAAHARMTVTTNDKLRGRGWADTPLGRAANAQRLDPRRLP